MTDEPKGLVPAGQSRLDRLTLKTLKSVGYKSLSDRVRYRNDIVAFAEEVLGIDLAPYQRSILQNFLSLKRIAVRAPRGAGKTTLSAILVLWAVSVHDGDVKVITTASAWRQLIRYTWPEIHKWAHQADWAKVGVTVRDGVELTSLTFKLGDRIASAESSDIAESIEGAHASLMIGIFDEAKAIKPKLWDAMEGAFSTGRAYAFAISTPGVPSGRFYDIHARKRGYEEWTCVHVTLAECIAAGRFSAEWAEQRRLQWGETSAAYQNYVLANFSESSEDVVVPLSWIEAANERWELCEGVGEGVETWGCDPGWKGADPTVICKLVGNVVELLESRPKQDLMQTAGRLTSRVAKTTPIGIDSIGIGAGLYSRLQEMGFNAKAVNASEKTDYRDATRQIKFFNLRAYLWWSIREALDPDLGGQLALPPDNVLTGDLMTPTWGYTSNGTVQVESKADIRERLDRSTDRGDAVCLAWYVASHHGLSPEQVKQLASGKLRPSALSETLKAFMRSSGVKFEDEPAKSE